MTRIGRLILIIFLVSTYEAASASDAGNATAHFAAASVLVQQERYADALEEFREVIRVSANQEEVEGALYWIGQCYQRQGKPVEARETFNQLIAKYPDSELVPMVRVFLAQIPAVELNPRPLAQSRYQRLEPPRIDTENNESYWNYETKQWLTISPDETKYACAIPYSRGSIIMVASLDQPDALPTPLVQAKNEDWEADGQRGSIHHYLHQPVWSPDGKWVAYYSRTVTSIQRIPFALGSVVREDVNRSGSISDHLRQAFANNDVSLSPNTVLSIDQPDHVWRIADEPNGMEYRIFHYKGSFWAHPNDDSQIKGETELYIVPATGGEPQLVVNLDEPSSDRGAHVRGLSWSADSKRLAYAVYKDTELKQKGIYIASVDGSKIEQFANADIGIPVWSPDGKWIAFSAWRKFLFWRQPGVWIRSVETGAEYKIPNSIANPVWSPDGKAIAYTGMLSWFGKQGILATAVNNGKPAGEPYLISREKLNTTRRIFHWSKDGRLTFLREDQKKDLYIVSTDRPHPVKQNVGAGLETYQWMPDGSRLLLTLIPDMPEFHVGYVQSNRGGTFQKLPLARQGLQIVEAVPSTDGRKLALTAIQTATFQQISMDNPWPSMGIHLYTVDADGRNLKQITQGKTVNGGPRWSPDGKQIAFLRIDAVNGWWSSIYLIDAAGGEATSLTSNFNDRDMSWSPDGKRIAFLRMRGKSLDADESDSDIFVLPASGGQETQLSTDRSKKYNLHWSPDGKYLAYDKQGEVWIMSTSGGKPRRMATANTGSNLNRWSPEGKSLLTIRGRKIWTHPIDGSEPTEIELQEFSEQIESPTWSPDGTRIAFSGRVTDLGWWRVQVTR